MGFLSRKPTSNDIPEELPNATWVREALTKTVDTVLLLLSGKAKRCESCKAPALLKYLEDGQCPNCRGADITPQETVKYVCSSGYDGGSD